MTDKLYLITGAQRDLIESKLMEDLAIDDIALIYDVLTMLQSLPMVDSEPVAWLVETEADAGLGILPYTVIAETEHGAGIREMLRAFQVYRTPQALTNREIEGRDDRN